jgi:hypothetical protein
MGGYVPAYLLMRSSSSFSDRQSFPPPLTLSSYIVTGTLTPPPSRREKLLVPNRRCLHRHSREKYSMSGIPMPAFTWLDSVMFLVVVAIYVTLFAVGPDLGPKEAGHRPSDQRQAHAER